MGPLERSQLQQENSTEHGPIVSFETRVIFDIVNFVTLCGPICLFGIVSNIINIIVFVKQGLDNTINISLFGLAISDLCGLITLEWISISNIPQVVYSDIPMDTPNVAYITGGWPHACFGHIICWITTYITAERCLCIALPMKVKEIITPRRTTMIICFMYVINIISFLPECSSIYIDWKFYPERNISLLALAYRHNREELEGVGFIMFGVLGTVCFPAVILFTAILVLKLRQQANWRMKSTNNNNRLDLASQREIKTMKMVVLIAVVLIVCYTPGIIVSVITFFVPGFSHNGKETNMFWVGASVCFVFEACNSSVNIFLYYYMSTKYKKMFHELFRLSGNIPTNSSNLQSQACE